MATAYTAAGFAVASIDYRLLKKNAVPVLSKSGKKVSRAFLKGISDNDIQFNNGRLNNKPELARATSDAAAAATEDAYKAVGWLTKNRKRYQLNMQQFAVAGGSAGAITALNLTYLLPELGLYKGPQPKAVIDLWGALTQPRALDRNEAALFIVHGTEDTTVPYDTSVMLSNRAKKVGVPHETYPIPGARHSFNSIPVASYKVDGITLQDRMIGFTARALRLNR